MGMDTSAIKTYVGRLARRRLGVEIRRIPAPGSPPTSQQWPYVATVATKRTVQWEVDERFRAIFREAMERSRSGHVDAAPRLYNLVQALAHTRRVSGPIAECGCFRGLSAYVIGCYLRLEDPSFTGAEFHVFDSFEGLSPVTAEDRPGDTRIPEGGAKRGAGLFRAGLDEVRDVLADFPDISFHPGWFPGSFADAPEGPYRFVHVDVDLHDPTRDALLQFGPRLAEGGLLVCDDYGFVRWPGSKAAVDAYCQSTGAPLLSLSSGQAIVMPPVRSSNGGAGAG